MAAWKAIAHPGHFAYDSKSVHKHWPRLHASDQEPPPESAKLAAAWASFHNGQLEAAYRQGCQLGAPGATVANQAACLYASQLPASATHRLALYKEVVDRAERQIEQAPEHANGHFMLACALGHYSQSLSVAKGLAQGLGSRTKAALEQAIALQPRHADAHFALGAFHADIIDKVGELIGHMTFGARRDTSQEMFRQGFVLQPQSARGLQQYAAALLTLEGDAAHSEAQGLYLRASGLRPKDVREALDIAQAQAWLKESGSNVR